MKLCVQLYRWGISNFDHDSLRRNEDAFRWMGRGEVINSKLFGLLFPIFFWKGFAPNAFQFDIPQWGSEKFSAEMRKRWNAAWEENLLATIPLSTHITASSMVELRRAESGKPFSGVNKINRIKFMLKNRKILDKRCHQYPSSSLRYFLRPKPVRCSCYALNAATHLQNRFFRNLLSAKLHSASPMRCAVELAREDCRHLFT